MAKTYKNDDLSKTGLDRKRSGEKYEAWEKGKIKTPTKKKTGKK